MINKTILEGRIAKPFDLRRTSQGNAVVNFSLAVERIRKSDDRDVDYFNCVAWNKMAENLERYCEKGSAIGVVGRLQTRDYENAQGQKVYVVEVYCEEIHYLPKPNTKENIKTHDKREKEYFEKAFDEAQQNFDIQDNDIQF